MDKTTGNTKTIQRQTGYAEVEKLIERLRCKAEASRVASLESDTDTRDPQRRWLCEDEAKALGVNLWMLRPQVVHAGLSSDLVALADCTEVTANAVESLMSVMRSGGGTPTVREKAVADLAEAQSMMRVAHWELQKKTPGLKPQMDGDQAAAFDYVTTTAKRNRVFIARYARKNDKANPQSVSQLRQKIEQQNEDIKAQPSIR